MANKNFLRLVALIKKTGVSRTSIHNRCNPDSKYFDKDFPQPIRLSATGKGAVVWLESEVDDWMDRKVASSRKPK